MKLFRIHRKHSSKKNYYQDNTSLEKNNNDFEAESELGQTVIDTLKEEGKLDDSSLSRNPSDDDVKRYLDAYGERIVLSDRQNQNLRKEYAQVTDYLTDIQKIDSIKDRDAAKLKDDASAIVRLEQERLRCQKQGNRLSKSQYNLMEQYSDIMNKELTNMKKREKYQMQIKNDMRNLETEKELLKDEQHEQLNRQRNLRNISIGTGVLVLSIFAFLSVVWIYSKYDMTIPFIIAVALAGIIVLYIITGIRKVHIGLYLNERKLNKAITLLNGVKIKYINNTALLDYMCGKFNISNSIEMEHVWNQYLKAKSDEEKLSTNAAETLEKKNSLEALLKSYEIKDTEVWTYQAAAFLDNREMVEVRHKLNVRRHKLREQIAYNDNQIKQASYVIWKILKSKPKYKTMIDEMLKRNSIENVVVASLRR